jgi:hypothetical protein
MTISADFVLVLDNLYIEKYRKQLNGFLFILTGSLMAHLHLHAVHTFPMQGTSVTDICVIVILIYNNKVGSYFSSNLYNFKLYKCQKVIIFVQIIARDVFI